MNVPLLAAHDVSLVPPKGLYLASFCTFSSPFNLHIENVLLEFIYLFSRWFQHHSKSCPMIAPLLCQCKSIKVFIIVPWTKGSSHHVETSSRTCKYMHKFGGSPKKWLLTIYWTGHISNSGTHNKQLPNEMNSSKGMHQALNSVAGDETGSSKSRKERCQAMYFFLKYHCPKPDHQTWPVSGGFLLEWLYSKPHKNGLYRCW
jgi:hypothetical protein